jgi:hypothetical protein
VCRLSPESPDTERFLEAMVLLEEFTRELAAVSESKVILARLAAQDRARRRANAGVVTGTDDM